MGAWQGVWRGGAVAVIAASCALSAVTVMAAGETDSEAVVPLDATVAQVEIEVPDGAIANSDAAARTPVDAQPSMAIRLIASRAGVRNGQLPPEALQRSSTGCVLAVDAAVAYDALTSAAASAGHALEHSGCYRTLEQQVATRARWCEAGACRFAAIPGTSMHGWGLAVDFRIGDRALSYGDALYAWLASNAPGYGFYHPEWARQGGSIPEPWHWEFATDGTALTRHGAARARPVPAAVVTPASDRIPA